MKVKYSMSFFGDVALHFVDGSHGKDGAVVGRESSSDMA